MLEEYARRVSTKYDGEVEGWSCSSVVKHGGPRKKNRMWEDWIPSNREKLQCSSGVPVNF